MTTFYLSCAVLGGIVVLFQSLFGLFEHSDTDHDAHIEAHDTLDLISLRSLSAGLAAFGLMGGLLTALGWWWIVTLPVAAVAGFLVTLGVAIIIRQMGRLEQDSSLVIEGAVGEPATVYIPIPAGRGGRGKITVVLQDQTIELEAITTGEALPTGAAVVITNIEGAVAEVTRAPSLTEGVF